MTITLRATPSATPCPECDGTGEANHYTEDNWPCLSGWDCAWCHGSGKALIPIPVGETESIVTTGPRLDPPWMGA